MRLAPCCAQRLKSQLVLKLLLTTRADNLLAGLFWYEAGGIFATFRSVFNGRILISYFEES